jgi:hypothetical protein
LQPINIQSNVEGGKFGGNAPAGKVNVRHICEMLDVNAQRRIT